MATVATRRKKSYGDCEKSIYHHLWNTFSCIVAQTTFCRILRYPDLKVVVGGLLHCDQNGLPLRSNVAEVNVALRRKTRKLKDFYIEEDSDWLLADGALNMDFYYSDCIHLNHKGNDKFGSSIIRKLKLIISSPDIFGIPTICANQDVVSTT